MAQSEIPDEYVGSPPPYIPLRNPLGGDLWYQASRRLTRAISDNNDNISPSSIAPTASSNIDHATDDAQDDFVSALYVQADHPSGPGDEQSSATKLEEAKMKHKIYLGKTSMSVPALELRDNISLESTKSSLAYGLKRYSPVLGQSDRPTFKSDSVRQAKQHDIEEAIARTRRSLDISDTFSANSSYDEAIRRESIVEEKEEEARIEAWLKLGALNTQAPESDCASQLSKATSVSIPQKSHALSLFPPTSPKTGRREYASPLSSQLSPMNNGRDAYGNFIPTNTRDYFAAPPSPSLSKLRPIVEDAREPSKNSVPSLRGGGGWWNTMGIGQAGKEPSAMEQPGIPTPPGSHHNDPAQYLKARESADGPAHVLRRVDADTSNTRSGGTYGESVAVTKNPISLELEESWSDESDHEIFENTTHRSSKQWEPSANAQFGSVQGRRKTNLRTLPPSPPSQTYKQDIAAYGQTSTPTMSSRRPSRNDERGSDSSESQPIPRLLFVAMEKPQSPLSDVSYSPRTQKRWNRGPASPPPSRLSLPPPPPPKVTKTMSEAADSVGAMRVYKYEYEHERPRSPAESYEDQAWELQSLQFGESVSVAEWAPRQVVPPHVPQTRSENFEAEQREAEIMFRPLCQNIMLEYNAETSRINRGLQLGELSPEQFKRQADHLSQNRENALQYSARIQGYVILTDEFAMLEALNNPNGYTIYHDMLHTTNPPLWSRLEEQHRQAQILQLQSSTTAIIQKPSRDSSLKSARRVGGKIARFILAAPSDPNLKTYSTRRQINWDTSSMPLAWMDPMAAVALSSPTNDDSGSGSTWTSSSMEKKEKEKIKGKGKAQSEPGVVVARHDFAPPASTSAMVTNTTSPNTKSRWTRKTAIPPPIPLDRPTKPTRQLPSFNPAYNAYKRHSVTSSVAATDTGTEVSLWPEGDSEGNWTIPRRPVMRGGDGGGAGEGVKEKKLKKKEEKEKRKMRAREEHERVEKVALIDRIAFGLAGEWGIRL